MSVSVSVSEIRSRAILRYDRTSASVDSARPDPDTLCVCLLIANGRLPDVKLHHVAIQNNVDILDNQTNASPTAPAGLTIQLNVEIDASFPKMLHTMKTRLQTAREVYAYRHIHVFAFEPADGEWCPKYLSDLAAFFDSVSSSTDPRVQLHLCGRGRLDLSNCIEEHCGPAAAGYSPETDRFASNELSLPFPAALARGNALNVLGMMNIDKHQPVTISKKTQRIVVKTCSHVEFSLCLQLDGYTEDDIARAFKDMDVTIDNQYRGFTAMQLRLLESQQAQTQYAQENPEDLLAQKMVCDGPVLKGRLPRQVSVVPAPIGGAPYRDRPLRCLQ